MHKPGADIELSVPLVGDLLRVQHSDLASLSISEAASGWDNGMFRLGDEMAVRLPRRAASAALIENEQRWLPLLQTDLPLPVPTPIRVGLPQEPYPWRWSIVPWIGGETADRSSPNRDQAPVFAAFLRALHRPPAPGAPVNPYRGMPLAQRQEAFSRGIATLGDRGYRLDDRL